MSSNTRPNKRPASTFDKGSKGPGGKPFRGKSGGGGRDTGKSQGGSRPAKPMPYGSKPYQSYGSKANGAAPKGKGGDWKGKDKEERNEPVQRRKQPVTAGGGEIDVNDDDDDDGDEDMNDVDGDSPDIQMDGEEEVGYADPSAADRVQNEAPQEKRPRLSKTEKAALHAAQPHRTTLLPSHALLVSILPIWERARKVDVPRTERVEAVRELWEAVKGRVGELSRGHKGGRVLQTIVKYGGKEERLGVAMELRPQWRAMMESKYSKFLMSKLIRYCPSIRPLLITDLSTHLPNLLAHAEAVQPLSDFFDLYATAKEKRQLVRGFYPKEVLVFDSGKEGDVEGLEDVLEKMGEGGKGRDRILDGVEKNVLGPFNATQKTALAQAIFHRLVNEYLTCIYRFLDAETADKKMHELLATSLESLPEIVHTKDGAAVVRQLLVRGNAKDRKQILQPLRKHLPAMAKDADAQLVLFTAFDCVDDTKLMGKAFVSDIVAMIGEIASDKNGRRTLLYLLTPTSTKHFLPATLRELEESAEVARKLGTSKKDKDVRRRELVGYASPGLLEAMEGKAEELVRDPGSGLLVQEIMLRTTGDKSSAITALMSPLRTPYPETPSAEPESGTAHPLELSHCVRTYKTLLSGGYFNSASKAIDILDSILPGLAAQAFWDAINSDDAGGEENVVNVACGAPFVVVELLSALPAAQAKAVKKVLSGKDAREKIGGSEAKGAALLLERLS